MTGQNVRFEYDSSRNILFADDDYVIKTVEDAERFLNIYRDKLKELGRRVWVVTSIDGLKVGANAYVFYGENLKTIAEKWFYGIARWGKNPESRMTVRMASRKAKADINIYDTKQLAIEAIEEMKRDQSIADSPQKT
jgi:hypothetical protein